MWERFSFYGMQAILAYYLYSTFTEGGLGMGKAHATALLGVYGSALYLCTFFGGWIADRLLGAERTLLAGALLLICGHLQLSLIPGYTGLILGLLPIALGSGLLKTAAITILGAAFPPDSSARDASFQIFYWGINLGAFCGPLITGWLAQRYSYHTGFIAAAALMFIGVIGYAFGRRRLLNSADDDLLRLITAPTLPLDQAGRRRALVLVILGGIAAAIALFALTPATISYVLVALTVGAAAYLFWSMFRSPLVTGEEKVKVQQYLPIFFCSATYWCLQAQIYGVLAVYSDQRLNREILGFTIPAAWTQSLNPLFILTLGPLFAALLIRRGSQGPHRRTLASFGVIIAGAGMFLLLPFVNAGTSSTPFLVLALTILTMTIGELFVGPVGMSATSAHAPRAFATRFSALYFLTMAIGCSLAGALSIFYDPTSPAREMTYLVIVGTVPILLGATILIFTRLRASSVAVS